MQCRALSRATNSHDRPHADSRPFRRDRQRYGGLAGCPALAAHFEEVVIVERDQAGDGPLRRGIPQAKHTHMLLEGGLCSLARLLPEIVADLVGAGAAPIRVASDQIVVEGALVYPRRDLGLATYGQTRSVLEACVRRRVENVQNVAFRYGCRMMGLLAAAGKGRVRGIEIIGDGVHNRIEADLVVDASGRNSQLPAWLARWGYAAPPLTQIEIGLTYASAVFDIPDRPRLDARAVAVGVCAPSVKRGGFLQMIEGHRWMVSLAGRHGDDPPGDLDGFRAFAAGLSGPQIHDAIGELAPLGPIQRFSTPRSIWRHYAHLTQFPLGLLAIGDAICQFNPTYGQGISSAAQQAQALGQLLSNRDGPAHGLDTLATRYFARAEQIVEAPWQQMALRPGVSRSHRRPAAGARLPPGLFPSVKEAGDYRPRSPAAALPGVAPLGPDRSVGQRPTAAASDGCAPRRRRAVAVTAAALWAHSDAAANGPQLAILHRGRFRGLGSTKSQAKPRRSKRRIV